MDSSLLVSVIITTHNRSNLLKRAIESVILQTYKSIEIIVIDDGSTDNTEEVANKYLEQHDNLKYLKHAEAKGANAARNKGIRHAQGKYIAGLDDDDEFDCKYIETLVNAYDDNYACVVAGARLVTSSRTTQLKRKNIISLDDLLFFNDIGNQVLVKKKNLLEAGLFDEALPACQDYDMWIRLLSACGPAKGVNLPLQIMHQDHNKNRTSMKSHKAFRGHFMFYKKHKNKMSRQQRKSQLSRIRYIQGKKLSLYHFIIFFHLRNLPLMLIYKRNE